MEVNALVKEEDSVVESILILLEKNVDQVSQEESVSHLDELAIVVEDLINIVSKDFLDPLEDVAVGLLRMNITQETKHHD